MVKTLLKEVKEYKVDEIKILKKVVEKKEEEPIDMKELKKLEKDL